MLALKKAKESEVGMDSVVHFEMPARDMKRVAEFYRAAFDWKMTQMGKEFGNYLLAVTSPMDKKNMHTKKGAINGGFFKQQRAGQPPHLVIAVDNLKAAIKKVKAAGGKIDGKEMDIPGIGLFAMVKDTEGNAVGILQPAPMEK